MLDPSRREHDRPTRLARAAAARNVVLVHGLFADGSSWSIYAVQEPFQKALLTGKTTQAAWGSKPSFYPVSTEDRTINPDLERPPSISPSPPEYQALTRTRFSRLQQRQRPAALFPR